MSLSLLNVIEASKPKNECGGLFFRYAEEYWIGSDNDVNFKFRFRWLKSKSCTGCPTCDWLWENLQEDICMMSWEHGPKPSFNKLVPGIYEYKVTRSSTDWETGICDDIVAEFVFVGPA